MHRAIMDMHVDLEYLVPTEKAMVSMSRGMIPPQMLTPLPVAMGREGQGQGQGHQ